MENQKISLTLCKKDAVLHKWKSKVMLKDDRILSFLVRQALMSFITKREFADIGHICFDSKIDRYEQYGKINVSISDANIIQEWMKSLTLNGIKPGDAIKSILTNSITIVAIEAEEYIPTYLDFSVDKSFIEQLKKVTTENISVVTSEKQQNQSINDNKKLEKPSATVEPKKVQIKDDKEVIEKPKPSGNNNLALAWGLGPKR